MNNKFIYGIIFVAIVIGAIFAIKRNVANEKTDKNAVVCNMEAKLCPDGSYVGRGGALCQFSPCPDGPEFESDGKTVADISLAVKIGQPASGMGVTITPLEVVEDSRCPLDVVCVWAGTVRLRVELKSAVGVSTEMFKLGMPITTEADEIELVDVSPEARSEIAIRAKEYRFKFKVSKRFPMEI